MALRDVVSRRKIDSMKSLVEELNKATDPVEIRTLRDWLSQSIDCFNKLMRESFDTLTVGDVQEYVVIGQLIVKGPSDRRLLQSWFSSLCNAILHGRLGEERIVAALDCALFCVDKRIFKEDPDQLLRLSNTLLAKLNPEETSFVKATYGRHRSTLSALHQSFAALHQASPKLFNSKSENCQAFKARLKKIADDQDYYPLAYHTMLIEQSIQKLEQNEKPSLKGALNRLFHGTVGALCIATAVRGIAALEFDSGSIEAFWTHFQEAFRTTHIRKKPWYDWIQELNMITLRVIQDPETYAQFEQCFDSLNQKQRLVKRKKDALAIRIGMIDQLVMLTSQAPEEGVRSEALSKLLLLAETSECEGWAAEVEIFEALLDALLDVYTVVKRKDEVATALEVIQENLEKPSLRRAFSDWLDGPTVVDKLSDLENREEEEDAARIFGTLQRTAKIVSLEQAVEYSKELKSLYDSKNFSEVSSSFACMH